MDRLACADLPALPLQLLLREHMDWGDHPVAVVEEDRPLGLILWVNERARARRILPGMRYAEGQSLAADLRAAVVPPRAIRTAVHRLTGRLRRFSPHIEPADHEPGVFWIDASGLGRLHPCLESWARSIVETLRNEEGFLARVVVGFSRFGSYALARGVGLRGNRVMVCASPEQEQRRARAVPLNRLAITCRLRDALHKLGVNSVEALVKLPAGALLERFGPEARELHALATGDLYAPLQPEPEVPPVSERADLDQPEAETTRLLFLIKHRLHRLLSILASRAEALRTLTIVLEVDGDDDRKEQLTSAEPTLDGGQLSDLVRLRLESVSRRGQLGRGVTAVELTAEGVRATREQLLLFAQRPRRDLEAANRALAQLRAELGPEAVTHAVLHDRHLPEARFAFEPLERLGSPKPTKGVRVLVRRLLPTESTSKPPRPQSGPFVLSGEWWRGVEVYREYHYACNRQGELLWLYYDRQSQRWMLQGRVE